MFLQAVHCNSASSKKTLLSKILPFLELHYLSNQAWQICVLQKLILLIGIHYELVIKTHQKTKHKISLRCALNMGFSLWIWLVVRAFFDGKLWIMKSGYIDPWHNFLEPLLHFENQNWISRPDWNSWSQMKARMNATKVKIEIPIQE